MSAMNLELFCSNAGWIDDPKSLLTTQTELWLEKNQLLLNIISINKAFGKSFFVQDLEYTLFKSWKSLIFILQAVKNVSVDPLTLTINNSRHFIAPIEYIWTKWPISTHDGHIKWKVMA